jgi:mono/diheme cytochrome c family protein
MQRLFVAATISLTLTACSGRDADLPEAYRRIDVPKAVLGTAEAREKGRALFLANCALCHGERGDGHGRRASGFARAPRDFTDPAWRRATTSRHVFFAIREGLHGTPMPAWTTFSDAETWDLVAYVLSLGEAATR